MNLKGKLLQCNANTKFNKACCKENIVPKCAVIKVTGKTKASKYTKQKTQRLRIQNEIKYLYKEKQVNKDLYLSHLYNSNQWQKLWTHIEQNITDKLHLEIGTKLKKSSKKDIQYENEKHSNTKQ
jgi:hypothetical protein